MRRMCPIAMTRAGNVRPSLCVDRCNCKLLLLQSTFFATEQTMSSLAQRIEYELGCRASQNERASVVGPEAADLRTAYVGGAFAQGGYPHLAQPHIPVGLDGVQKHISAPFGYGQDEDMYAGPTSFDHVPHIARPVPLGGVDDYHMASDPRLSRDRTLKEKYEGCAINHVTTHCASRD